MQLRLHSEQLSEDGDPSDVLVLAPVPLITGVVVRCRPIGMLKMDDEAGGDAKILAWVGPDEAKAEIVASVARYQAAQPRPRF